MKYVYFFGRDGDNNLTEGSKELKLFLGGKGANLAEMTNIGLPVPPGFTIGAAAQKYWVDEGCTERVEIIKQYNDKLAQLEKFYKQKLGDLMFVSVRSGASISMPGMMDTVLNLGINDAVMPKFIKAFGGDERFCYDSYRRFIQMFSDIAMGVELEHFEVELKKMMVKHGKENDNEIPVEGLKELIEIYKGVFKKHTKRDFPQDPKEQLDIAVGAVFKSWYNERAVEYRKLNRIYDDVCIGTAVNVQVMVYGNLNDKSGTGVVFTRDPANGEKKLFGEFLINAQGEDVVAGIRTPLKISKMETTFPESHKYLLDCAGKLENHYKYVQDMEFTIQDGKFYLLQTRNGKMTAHAECKVLVDMVGEKLITKKQAIASVNVNRIDHFLHKTFDPEAVKTKKSLGKGINASPGAAVGKIVFNNKQAVAMKEKGEDCILVRITTSPEDLMGMNAAKGILTSTGGRTSHAAVVARGDGKCCVCGFGEAKVDYEKETLTIKGKEFKKGEVISIDGTEGHVYAGPIKLIDPVIPDDFLTLLEWEKEFRKMGVYTNADTPASARQAVEFGAEGIGLTRTEHMFFKEDRIQHMREMILAEGGKEKFAPLAKLKVYQKDDFYGIFKAMEGRPVTIRLLDPPLHEFLPKIKQTKEIALIAKNLGITVEKVIKRIHEMHEENPMLGHRGCRLGITFPEITTMQAEAIYEAAYQLKSEGGKVKVDIMVPLINSAEELIHQRKLIQAAYDKTSLANPTIKVNCTIGTMIEVPRAAILSAEVVKHADFYSFGTNDLTQMTLGFSRDDAKVFIDGYCNLGLLKCSPFEVLDQKGVGWLVTHCVNEARKVKPRFKVGICGEHGGEPTSIEFLYNAGLNYVSCSPFRVLVARIAAAQSSIRNERKW